MPTGSYVGAAARLLLVKAPLLALVSDCAVRARAVCRQKMHSIFFQDAFYFSGSIRLAPKERQEDHSNAGAT
jgi:hypothetical protein